MPTHTVSLPGSAVLIHATNMDARQYTAVINFTWTYDSFGETLSQNVSTTAVVPANVQNHLIFSLQGAWVDVRVPGGVTIQYG